MSEPIGRSWQTPGTHTAQTPAGNGDQKIYVFPRLSPAICTISYHSISFPNNICLHITAGLPPLPSIIPGASFGFPLSLALPMPSYLVTYLLSPPFIPLLVPFPSTSPVPISPFLFSSLPFPSHLSVLSFSYSPIFLFSLFSSFLTSPTPSLSFLSNLPSFPLLYFQLLSLPLPFVPSPLLSTALLSSPLPSSLSPPIIPLLLLFIPPLLSFSPL